VTIFRNQNGPASKNLWETPHYCILQLLFGTFVTLMFIELRSRYVRRRLWVGALNVRHCRPIVMESNMCRQILVELPSSKFHEIRSVVNELVHANCRRDRRGVGNFRNMNIDRQEGKCRIVATEEDFFGRSAYCPR
jgi:hypothetical protein